MRFRRFNGAVALAATVLLVPLAGCPGHLEFGDGTGGGACVPQGGTTTPPATFETVRTAFAGFGAVDSCASAACHGANGMAPPLKPLTLQNDANLYMNMTTYISHACGDIPLVNPGKPNESALIKILNGPCGTTVRMPFGCVDEHCYDAPLMAAITQWIANCAPEQ